MEVGKHPATGPVVSKEESHAWKRSNGIPFRLIGNGTSPTTPKAKEQTKSPSPEQNTKSSFLPTCLAGTNVPPKTINTSGEVVDENGIITSPAEGTRKVYQRSGKTYKNDEQLGLVETEQSGYVQVVECSDGTVYIRNIVSSFGSGAWVKGIREGDTITIPTRQPVIFKYGETASVRWGICEYGVMFSSYDDYADHFTFTVDDEAQTITLEGTSAEIFMGVFWDSDQAFAWSGDYGTVWTYDHDFAPLQQTTVTPPSDLVTETWFTKGHTTENDTQTMFTGNATVGFDGDDVYLKGVFSQFPDAWMKGTIDGTSVTFSGLQLQGTSNGVNVYAVGTDDSDLMDFHMTWDAGNKKLTSDNSLLANAHEEYINSIVWMNDITIQYEDPFKPIEDLPYTNSFDTRDEWEMFTVINANNDSRTWTNIDNTARYHYDPSNSADDWLISPALRLEAGKTYHFAIDTYNQNYDERLEVKMGKSATVEGMTTEVIPSTDIVWTDPKTIENNQVTVSETGLYYIGIHAISDPDENMLYVDNFLIEEFNLDAPSAVTQFSVTPDKEQPEALVALKAPVKNIAGGMLKENLTKIEVLRDGQVVKTFEDVKPGEEQTFTDAENLTVGYHTYQAIPYNSYGKGEKSEEIAVYINKVLDVPYTADFTDETVFSQFMSIDANDDLFSWLWDPNNDAYYGCHAENAADDYLVTLPIRMEAGKTYNVTVKASVGSSRLPERLEVKAGKEASVEGLNTAVIAATDLTNEEAEPLEGTFTPDEDGNYHIALHCISDADMFELRIHGLTVEVGAAPTSPAAPAIEVVPGALGALNATISVTAPTTSADDNALAGHLTKMEVYRGDDLIATREDVAPGASMSITDEVDASGIYTYRAIPYNASGMGEKSERKSAYIGIDEPEEIASLTTTDNVGKVSLHWEKVGTVGKNGGYVNPAGVDYRVYGSQREDGWLTMGEDPIEVLTDADSYDAAFDTEEGNQEYSQWGVQAGNEAGETYIRLSYLLVGESYRLPVVEGFTNYYMHYWWESNGKVMTFADATDGDGVSMGLVAEEAGEMNFISGKINIKDAVNPTLIFDVLGSGVSNVKVVGDINQNGEWSTLASSAVGGSFTTVKVPLSSLKDGNYVQIGFVADCTTPTVFDSWTEEMISLGDFLIMDNIRIVDLLEHDLSATVSAPKSVKAGQTAAVGATVKNEGEQPAKDFTVTISVGNEELLKETVSTPLAAFEEMPFTATYSPTIFDETGVKAITVQVDYSEDLKPSNNTAETTITLNGSSVPSPENLTAEENGDGMGLSWDAPSVTTMEVTEEFEDGMGDFTTIDADGDGHDWTYHNNENETSLYQIHSGEGSVYSESYSNGSGPLTPDNWLVTPMAILNGTFSFWASAQDESWTDEHFAIYVSTTSATDPGAFTQVSDEFVATGEMTEYTADLSAYAGQPGYIAIRHFNVTDQFSLVVDDITYTKTSGQPVGYNVYVDEVLVATVEGGVTTYTVAGENLADGEHQFSVTAVYANGQESSPVSITVTDAIHEIAADGKPVDIYTIDGRQVRRQATSLEGLRGIYVINGKTVVVR